MKIYLSIILGLIFTFSTFGQTNQADSVHLSNPNLSGVWMMETTSRAPKKRTAADIKPVIIVLTHKEPQLNIKKIIFVEQKPLAEERTFFTDNRGETYQTLDPRPAPSRPIPVTMKSKTKWIEDRKLYIETNISLDAPVGVLKRRMFEEWSLSKDSKTITRKIRFIDDNENQVFQRGDVEPSRIEEWLETYHLISQSEIDKLMKN